METLLLVLIKSLIEVVPGLFKEFAKQFYNYNDMEPTDPLYEKVDKMLAEHEDRLDRIIKYREKEDRA